MPIIQVSRWKGNQDYAQAARPAAAIIKKHGAMSVRVGRCHSGPHAGQLFVAVVYPDWAAYARATQALAADVEFQRMYAEFSRTFELQDRSVTVAEDF